MNQNELNDIREEQQRLLYLIEDRVKRLRNKGIFNGHIKDNLMVLQKQITEFPDSWSQIIVIEQQIRELYAVSAGLMSSTDWQSPSFLDTGKHRAGSQYGKIKQAINDYKRDQHLDAIGYEEQFRKEYIKYSFFRPVRIFATNSGMAAFTTILGFLQGENIIGKNIIAIGKHSYFENILILKKLFPNQLVFFDENNSEEITFLAKEKKPAVWFLDSLCNDSTLTLPDLKKFFTLVKEHNPFIVLDNTCVSIFCQPFIMQYRPNNLIVWESLLKYHQFGLDRVNGGIVYAQCQNASQLYTYRDQLGTNISDYAIHALPLPDRSVLTRRLLHHEHNRTLFATIVKQYLTHHKKTNIQLIVPTLNQHHHSFLGSHIVITIHSSNPVSYYNRLLKRTMDSAKKYTLDTVGGTSFGFSTTRFYVPSARPGQGNPFFRISVGTEPSSLLQKLAESFCEALSG